MGGQRSEVGKRRTKGPRTEDRRQMTENRRSEGEKVRRQMSEVGSRRSENIGHIAKRIKELNPEPLNLG
jgi:hypothetical protein